MATTNTTQWDDSVKSLYDADYLIGATEMGIWEQFCVRKRGLGAKKGSAIEFPVYEKLIPQTTALDQNNDVTPITSVDNAVSISLTEYGAAVRRSVMLEATAYTDTHRAIARQVAINRAESIELRLRNVAIGGSRFFRYTGARTSLDYATSAHRMDNTNLQNLNSQARVFMMTPWEGETYAGVIPPCLASSLAQDSTFVTTSEYHPTVSVGANIFTGEVGKIASVRLIVSNWAKVYVGGGLVAQAATTSTAAVAAGDTTVSVTSATGLAAKQSYLAALNSPNSVDNWICA